MQPPSHPIWIWLRSAKFISIHPRLWLKLLPPRARKIVRRLHGTIDADPACVDVLLRAARSRMKEQSTKARPLLRPVVALGGIWITRARVTGRARSRAGPDGHCP